MDDPARKATLDNPYKAPTSDPLVEEQTTSSHLIYVAPLAVATAVTGALLVVGAALVAVIAFFQSFDPAAPEDHSGLLMLGAIGLVGVFVAILIACLCFNALAPSFGGIRYKVR